VAGGAPTVHTERDGPVAVITIDRPAVRNAVDGPTAAALSAAVAAFEGDDSLATAVLTGAGGTFCAGADLKAVAAGPGPETERRVLAEGDGPMGPTRRWPAKPVLAAVEGHAVAGGLELALWCDLRVAAASARFGVSCRRWGVPLIDGGTVRLPRLVGHGRALDLILTGRMVDAEEALRIGLADRVVADGEALAAAVALAHELAALPQTCLRSDRRSALEQWDLPTEAALANEAALGRDVLRSGESREGAARFASGAGRHGAPA
jgi:enoyl-CoA hydratase